MHEVLADKKSDWRQRNKVLNFFVEYCKDLSREEFAETMELLVDSLAMQVQERKSAVSREACLAVAMLSKARTTQMLPFVKQLFPGLFAAIRMNIKIINESGTNAGRAVVRFVPDSDNHELLDVLIIGTKQKHKQVRAKCFEYLEIILEQEWSRSRFDSDPEYWHKFKSVLKKGTGDKDASARKNAFKAIIALKKLDMEPLFIELEDELTPSEKKKLRRAENTLR